MRARALAAVILVILLIGCQTAPTVSTATSPPGETSLPAATGTPHPTATQTAILTPTVSPVELKRRAAPVCENAFSALVESAPLTPPFAVLKTMEYADIPSWDISHPLPHLGSISASEVKTIFCVAETQSQAGTYADGSAAYQFFWDIRVVSWPGGRVIGKNSFTGSQPPETKMFSSGADEDLLPYKEFAAWVFNQVEHPDFLFFNDAITSLALSPDGRLAAFGTAIENEVVDSGYQAKIFLFDPTNTQTELGTTAFRDVLDGHQGMVTSLAFSPDGTMLASSGYDRFIKFWDAQTDELAGQVNLPDTPNFLAFSPDGSRLAVASNLEISLVNFRDVQNEKSISVSSGDHLAFSPDGNVIYIPSPFSIRVVDVSAGQAILEFPDPSTLVPTMTVADDGTVLGVTYETPNTVDNFALSPDGKQVITVTIDQSIDGGSGDGNVRLATWDARSGKYISEINFSAESIQEMKFSSDGSRLALGNGNEIWVWDTSSWQLTNNFSGHVNLVEDLAFTPDGTKLLSASRDGTIRVWSLEP